jgi:hypothetical protein
VDRGTQALTHQVHKLPHCNTGVYINLPEKSVQIVLFKNQTNYQVLQITVISFGNELYMF